MPPPPELVTARLRLRPLVSDDAEFIVALLNDPDFIRFVGDREVHDREGAIRYLRQGPWASYEAHGYGPWAVERREGGEPLGICGLWRRDDLDAPDLGYAFLPAGRGRGFAREAAAATLAWARDTLGLSRVLAITGDDHLRSQQVLEAIGMVFDGHVRLAGEDIELRVYAWQALTRRDRPPP
ncbi:MAG TPA: GNAT family N-acetyltransferase [Enhygromyxa sp.]|nr:GNAT family N-acetyltransferase [Enhygromyxa sp.]